MHRAAELLSKETLSVKAIALCLGFHDPGYFSRFFRQRTGRTPSAFRAAARAVNARMVGHAYCLPTGQENHRLEFSVVINPDPINAPRVRGHPDAFVLGLKLTALLGELTSVVVH
jgi:hypothetical protein